MKPLFFPLLLILIFFAACARQGNYVEWQPPPEEKVLVIPQGKSGASFRPYEVNGERYYPLPDSRGFVQTGYASWYGSEFHGRPTASGKRFDMFQETAAHKTLPLGTYVRVRNLENGKETVVRINDRGPFVKGRIIDLSYAAAKDIGLVGPGVAKVRIVALAKQIGEYESRYGKEPVVEARDLQEGNFTVQVGAFREKGNALKLAARLKPIFDYVRITPFELPGGSTLYRLRVTKTHTLKKAAEMEKRLEAMGFPEAFIVGL